MIDEHVSVATIKLTELAWESQGVPIRLTVNPNTGIAYIVHVRGSIHGILMDALDALAVADRAGKALGLEVIDLTLESLPPDERVDQVTGAPEGPIRTPSH